MSNSPLFLNKGPRSAKPGAGSVAPGARQKNVRKRWMVVGVLGMVGVMASAAIFSDKKAPAQARQKEAGMVSVTPPNADKVAFEAKFGKDMELMRAQVEKLVHDNKALTEKVAAQEKDAKEKAKEDAKNNRGGSNANSAPPNGIVPPPSMNGNSLGALTPDAPPPPPVPPTRPGVGTVPSGMPPLSTVPPAPVAPAAPMVFEFKGATGPNADKPLVNASVSYKKNANAGLLPAGSFAQVVLLNGLEAGTSAATQSNPMPVLMNITEQATLPGSAKYKLKSCFVLGNGYGDLSAERVYMRFNRMSCVDKNDRLVLSQEVAGYVVDSDGKLGMRGKVFDRQGARLGKALLAGFAQGLSGALGSAQGTITSNIGTGSTMNSISGSAALRQSGLSGAQTAAQQIAEFYLREAQAIFPVVSVDTGRAATIVFTNSVSLNWGSGESQYVQSVTPNN